jgi:hypothetical protein
MDAAGLPPVLREAGGPWFGEDGLWASLPDWRANLVEGSYNLKHAWVTLDEGRLTSRHGPPTVHAIRLDAPGRADASSGGYASADAFEFWPTVVAFPATGCWMEVGILGDTVVRFVIRVYE